MLRGQWRWCARRGAASASLGRHGRCGRPPGRPCRPGGVDGPPRPQELTVSNACEWGERAVPISGRARARPLRRCLGAVSCPPVATHRPRSPCRGWTARLVRCTSTPPRPFSLHDRERLGDGGMAHRVAEGSKKGYSGALEGLALHTSRRPAPHRPRPPSVLLPRGAPAPTPRPCPSPATVRPGRPPRRSRDAPRRAESRHAGASVIREINCHIASDTSICKECPYGAYRKGHVYD